MKTNRRAFNFFICDSQVMLAFFQKDCTARQMSVSSGRQAQTSGSPDVTRVAEGSDKQCQLKGHNEALHGPH